MIHRIFSNLESFKTLEFRPGLNILISDRSPESTDRHSRNGSGKSSLTEIVHFLMGSSCEENCMFRRPSLADYRFGMEFDLGGYRTVVERAGGQPRNIVLVRANSLGWPKQPKADLFEQYIPNPDWKTVLAQLIFGIIDSAEDNDKDFGPGFRPLLSYLVRRQGDNGFMEPKRCHEYQALWQQQVCITFLLGLDWTIAQDWQKVRQREQALKSLKQAAKEGLLGTVIGTVAELRTQLALAENHAQQLSSRLAVFQVLEEYQELEREVSQLTMEFNDLANFNIADRHHLDELLASLDVEFASQYVVDLSQLEALYEEVGVVVQAGALRTFEQAAAFHRSVLDNRRSYLQEQINILRDRIRLREERKREVDQRKSQVMSILQTHGALENYSALQSELSRREAIVEAIRQRYIAAEQWESQSTELLAHRNNLQVQLNRNYKDNEDLLRKAILMFQDTSNALFQEAGNLEINATENGPFFGFTIPRGASKGISNMQIFCFDMMLTRLCMERTLGPGFLFHDSHLFDGVDSRQIGHALKVGADMARTYGFQYIVTMNSDDLPQEFPEGFNLDEYILPVKLTDSTENGGLFGVRF